MSGGRPYTDEEISIMRENTDRPIEWIAGRLDRTVHAVRGKMHVLGLLKSRRWTEAEDEIIKKDLRMTARELADILPGRSESAVHRRRDFLGISGYQWTKEEDDLLRSNPDMPVDEAARLINRTRYAVQHRRQILGIKRKQEWTPEDSTYLHQNQDKPISVVAAHLGKTKHAVSHERKRLRITRRLVRSAWSKDEDHRLQRYLKTKMPRKDIASLMGRSLHSVNTHVKTLDLGKHRAELAWTAAEDGVLKDNRGMTAEELASLIKGRSPSAIRGRIHKLGLPNKMIKTSWTGEEKALLKNNLHLKRHEIHALFPHRTKNSVDGMYRLMDRKRVLKRGYSDASGYRQRTLDGRAELEHRANAEIKMGRKLRPEEVVHHINGRKSDNWLGNLDVLPNQAAHQAAEKTLHLLVKDLLESGRIRYDRASHTYAIVGR